MFSRPSQQSGFTFLNTVPFDFIDLEKQWKSIHCINLKESGECVKFQKLSFCRSGGKKYAKTDFCLTFDQVWKKFKCKIIKFWKVATPKQQQHTNKTKQLLFYLTSVTRTLFTFSRS